LPPARTSPASGLVTVMKACAPLRNRNWTILVEQPSGTTPCRRCWPGTSAKPGSPSRPLPPDAARCAGRARGRR
jgi:hypothetical protein